MRIFAILRIAFKALLRNKMRSILTMLGIIIGVASVIVMVSVGKGTGAMMAARIASLGENVLTVYAGNFRRGGVSFGMGGAGTLKVDDAIAIRDELSGVKAVSPEVRNNAQAIASGKNWSTNTYGVDTSYIDIRKWPLQAGSFFTDQEVKQAAKVAVIGSVITRELFDSQEAIGQTIRIGNIPFTVIGQLSTKGASMSGTDQDDSILVPYTTAMKRLSRGGGGGFGGMGGGGGGSGGSRSGSSSGSSSSGSSSGGGSSSMSNATPLSLMSLRSIFVQAESKEMMGYVQDQITELLRKRHKITSGDDDFSIRNQDEISDLAENQANDMALLLASIAGVSLIVGGIGIMNIMLVSVTERTREIGIRMAVGAKGRDILMQFLTEACVLSALGGLLGIAIGVGGAHYLKEYRDTPTLIPGEWIGYAVAFSAVIGIFFGLYPARKAAKLDPIEALRYE